MEAITSEGKRRKGKEKGEKEIKIFGYSLHKKITVGRLNKQHSPQ